MQLKDSIIEQIRTAKRLKIALMDYYDCSPSTLQRKLENNDRSLTEFKALQIMCAYLQIDDPEDLVINPQHSLSVS